MTGWEKVAGQQHQSEMQSLDTTCHHLTEFLANPNTAGAPTFTELRNMTTTTASYRKRTDQLHTNEQKAVTSYLASIDDLISMATAQVHTLRNQATTEFRTSSALFAEMPMGKN